MHTRAIAFKIKSFVDAAVLPLYWLHGRPPWSVGYHTAKKRAIEAAIDRQAVRQGVNLPAGFGIAINERVVEYPWIFGHLIETGKARPRVLDAGSILNHDCILNRAPSKGSDLTIMTLAPEKYCRWYDGFSYVYGDLRETFFDDQTLDTVICISTIEHIGLDNTLLYTSDQQHAERDGAGFLAAAREFRRILRPGGICYVSFRFGARQNLGWYQVFDESMGGSSWRHSARPLIRSNIFAILRTAGNVQMRRVSRTPSFSTCTVDKARAVIARRHREP